MPNQSYEELNEELVRQYLCYVTGKGRAWILLQEPGFIGFGAVYKDKICWPPSVEKLDWTRIRDLRLFGEIGEWHVWPHWNGGWKSRLRKLDDIDDALTESHVLWGDWPPKPAQEPWVKLVETQGTEIWLPIAESQLGKNDFPLRLKLKQVVGYDDKNDNSSHLAGIVDAVLVALVNTSGEKVVLPPLHFPSCSEADRDEEEVNCSNGDLPDTRSNS